MADPILRNLSWLNQIDENEFDQATNYLDFETENDADFRNVGFHFLYAAVECDLDMKNDAQKQNLDHIKKFKALQDVFDQLAVLCGYLYNLHALDETKAQQHRDKRKFDIFQKKINKVSLQIKKTKNQEKEKEEYIHLEDPNEPYQCELETKLGKFTIPENYNVRDEFEKIYLAACEMTINFPELQFKDQISSFADLMEKYRHGTNWSETAKLIGHSQTLNQTKKYRCWDSCIKGLLTMSVLKIHYLTPVRESAESESTINFNWTNPATENYRVIMKKIYEAYDKKQFWISVDAMKKLVNDDTMFKEFHEYYQRKENEWEENPFREFYTFTCIRHLPYFFKQKLEN